MYRLRHRVCCQPPVPISRNCERVLHLLSSICERVLHLLSRDCERVLHLLIECCTHCWSALVDRELHLLTNPALVDELCHVQATQRV